MSLTLYQIFTDNNYVYVATSSGLDIVDLVSENTAANINYPGGFNTVWGNTSSIYLGTTNSGIKSLSYTTISGNISDPYDLSSHLIDLYNYPYISSNNIKYIHGNEANLLVCTNSGVDYIRTTGNPIFVSSTSIAGVQKCFLSSTSGYYTTSGTEYSLNRIDNMNADWSTPSRSYVTGSGIFDISVSLNDMYVTNGTGSDGISNCIFCATSSGIYIIDESQYGSEVFSKYLTE